MARNLLRAVWVLAIGLIWLMTACGPDTILLRPALDTPVQHVKNGHRLLLRGNIEAADEEFLRAKGLDESYVPAYVGIALVQGRRGDINGGLETLEQARQWVTTPEEGDAVDEGVEQLRRMRPATVQ